MAAGIVDLLNRSTTIIYYQPRATLMLPQITERKHRFTWGWGTPNFSQIFPKTSMEYGRGRVNPYKDWEYDILPIKFMGKDIVHG